MSKRKNTLVAFVAIGIIAALGIMVSRQVAARRAASESPATETAMVQRGDVTITVEAAGSLASPTKFTLVFPVAGRIYEIPVAEGQAVEQGDLLARLEGNLQAETDFQALFSDAGIAQAELALTHAQDALAYAVDDLAYLIGVDAYHWEEQLKQAEERLAALDQNPNATVRQKIEAQKAMEEARGWRDYYRELNIKKLEKEYKDYEVFKTIRVRGHTRHVFLYTISYKVDTELILAYANWESAKVNLQDTQAALEIVQAGPQALQSPLAALGPEMARLESARRNAENTRLLAPVDGVVTKFNFQVGEIASRGAPVLVVSNLATLEAEVNLDETDVSRIHVGMIVLVSVDAFPGQSLSGQVTEIALSANIQSGVVLYPVTVRLDLTDLPLRSGMTVNVTFPIEQRADTLVVPFRAIETEGGQAYVTRLTASGFERVAVTMGLITDTQIEILSGLEAGDVVMVYANPVQDSAIMHSPIFGGAQ
jgi:RND family efflux transporter MFP subunit